MALAALPLVRACASHTSTWSLETPLVMNGLIQSYSVWPLFCLFVVLIVVFGVLRLLIWVCTGGPSSPPSYLRRQVSTSSSSAGFSPTFSYLPHSHPHLHHTSTYLPPTATFLPLSGTYLPSTPTNSSALEHARFCQQQPPGYQQLLSYQHPADCSRQLDVSKLPTYQEAMESEIYGGSVT